MAAVLTAPGEARGDMQAVVQCLTGTEFTSIALDQRALWNKVKLDFSRPGKPVDNSVVEAFKGSVRREASGNAGSLPLPWPQPP